MSQWKTVYKSDYEGRRVKVCVYGDRESFKVKTTLKAMNADPSLTRLYSEGEPIDIDEDTADGLILELIANDFSDRDAREIALHCRGEDMPGGSCSITTVGELR